MMRHKWIAATSAVWIALIVVFHVAASDAQEDGADTYRQLNLFGDVFERVRSDYVEEVTDEELVKSAINGMLQSLDPHSSYMDAKNFEEMQVQTKGEFGGLGIEVTLDSGFVKVVSPLDDTPAAQAGVQPGDFITHLEGESVLGLSLSEAVEKMRGPVGTDLTVTIRREGEEPFDLTITRAVITIESVRSRAEGNVGYIRITAFNEHADDGLSEALEELDEELGEDIAGIVLDLRNNPGGLLDQAIEVSDAFIDKGEIVSTRGRLSEDIQRYNADEGDLAHGLPMVVLINGGSASASEIVAGALQDHGRAIVLGTRSFGKGSVQTIVPLGSHGAMRLTTARYYTPSGTSIQATGIVPDITIERARIERVDTAATRREEDLRGRLENPGANGEGVEHDDEAAKDETGETGDDADAGASEDADDGSDKAAETDDDDAFIEDYQLSRAIDLIRGLQLFRAANVQ
ncbi:MAG: S41 family peptidase [Alphaproteobacteria bacterium]|nr:S41 family peptidase [Alphaproteobacteria bacterium]